MATIDRIDIHRVAMPLIYPFRTAFGNDETIESVLVRVQSGDACGWGETAPWRIPAYSPECAAGVFMIIRDFLAPLVLGREIASGDELQSALSPVKGNRFAKAGLDLAWWDLDAKLKGVPLWKAVGGEAGDVEVGADFGIMETVDALIETIGGAVRAGFKRVKLKYRPGWELDVISAVRAAFPDLTVHVDCNSAYTLAHAEMFEKLDAFGLAMIEQPLTHDDLVDHAELQRRIETPVCLDESITSVDKARKAIAIGACKWVNIKPGRVGGITTAVAIHDLCRDAGVPCWIGGMLESAVGASHCLALATLPNVKYPSDVFPTDRFYTTDLAEPSMVLSGPSLMTPHDVPGVGAEPHPERLRERTMEHVTLTA